MSSNTTAASSDAFFRRDGDAYLPQPECRGPWDPGSLHGRVVAGLLAHAIETQHGSAELMPARLTVDMYRLPDFSPMTVETRIVRDGRRIKVVDAEVFSAGKSVGRASCQLLLRTANAPGNIWRTPNWDAAAPETLAPPEYGGFGATMWDMRPITPIMSAMPNKRTWMREIRDLVSGIPITPWLRVALAADFASPFANSGDEGLGYINTDLSLYLHREPRGQWLGLETVNHQATDGVAIGECFVYDKEGPIGSTTVCALAQAKKV